MSTCCRPTSSADDIDPYGEGRRNLVRALQAQNRELLAALEETEAYLEDGAPHPALHVIQAAIARIKEEQK